MLDSCCIQPNIVTFYWANILQVPTGKDPYIYPVETSNMARYNVYLTLFYSTLNLCEIRS